MTEGERLRRIARQQFDARKRDVAEHYKRVVSEADAQYKRAMEEATNKYRADCEAARGADKPVEASK